MCWANTIRCIMCCDENNILIFFKKKMLWLIRSERIKRIYTVGKIIKQEEARRNRNGRWRWLVFKTTISRSREVAACDDKAKGKGRERASGGSASGWGQHRQWGQSYMSYIIATPFFIHIIHTWRFHKVINYTSRFIIHLLSYTGTHSHK